MNSQPASQFALILKAVKPFAGAQVYLVGGAVRDQLLQRPTTDYDFIVTNVSASQLEKALAKHGTINLVGKTFGVFKFQPSDQPEVMLDIALPRTEHSWGTQGGYKEFDIQSDPSLPIEQDLERRDFTVNAMAMNVLTGELVDLFNGQADLKNKLIRAVGEPGLRFDEDASRLLRALRFACELSFEIEPATWTALKERVAKLADPVLPREVVGREIVKAFIGDPARALKLFDEAGAVEVLMPELLTMKGCEQPEEFHSEGDVWVHTGIALEKVQSRDFANYFPDGIRTADLKLATLFHDIGKPLTKQTPTEHGTDRVRFNNHDVEGAKATRTILERLRMASSGLINADRIEWLVRHHLVLTHANVEIMKPTTRQSKSISCVTTRPGKTC